MASTANRELSKAFDEALVLRSEQEDRITVRPGAGDLARIFVDGGKEHAYFAYTGLGETESAPEALWNNHISVVYATEESYYKILDVHKVEGTIARNPEFLANMAIDAVKAHVAKGFTK